MASGGKGGKSPKWPGRDCRPQYGGPGARPRPQAKPAKKLGKGVCSICMGVCCSVSRELIAEAFKLGAIDISPKVCLNFGLVNGTYILFQDFDKCITDALAYARTRRPLPNGQGGSGLDREGEVYSPWVSTHSKYSL